MASFFSSLLSPTPCAPLPAVWVPSRSAGQPGGWQSSISSTRYVYLAIQEEDAAALVFEDLRLLPEGPEKTRIRWDMLAYCHVDTQAMVDLTCFGR
ncbi:MAG: hypothetical protein LLG45_12115 [Actinomycetia bacterium]|nr:hypothetical protein [Actinomycetes bacterium]